MELQAYTPRCSSDCIVSPGTRSTTGVLPGLQKTTRLPGFGGLLRLKKIKTVFTACCASTNSRTEEQNFDYEKNLMSSLSRRRPEAVLNFPTEAVLNFPTEAVLNFPTEAVLDTPTELCCSHLTDIEECSTEYYSEIMEEEKLKQFLSLGVGETDPELGDAPPHFRKWTGVVKSASTGLIPEVSSVSMQSEILKECFEILDAEIRERVGRAIRAPPQRAIRAPQCALPDGRRDQNSARNVCHSQTITMD